MSDRYHRRVIRISALNSPNVKRGLEQQRQGITPTNEEVIPGVLSWAEYQYRLATWDEVRRSIGLAGLFWEGHQTMLFPADWRARGVAYWETLRGRTRKARAVGVDPAEGGDMTSMAAVDEHGIIEVVSERTPDTDVVTGKVLAFVFKHYCPTDHVVFDRGGGGKEHADRLRAKGYPVRSVGFGEAPTVEIKRGLHTIKDRKEIAEDRYAYKNRRAEMYGELSLLLDPKRLTHQRRPDGQPSEGKEAWFAIPGESEGEVYRELHHQMSVMPRLYNEEGRLYLPGKNKRDDKDTRRTLVEMVGHSPDELDAVVLAVHGMLHEAPRSRAGAV